MATPSHGTNLLTAATRPRINLTQLARKTDLTRQRLRTLAAGGEPTASEMELLRRELGIPLEAWTRPAPAAGAGSSADGDGGAAT